jgi:hypothetical protein
MMDVRKGPPSFGPEPVSKMGSESGIPVFIFDEASGRDYYKQSCHAFGGVMRIEI